MPNITEFAKISYIYNTVLKSGPLFAKNTQNGSGFSSICEKGDGYFTSGQKRGCPLDSLS